MKITALLICLPLLSSCSLFDAMTRGTDPVPVAEAIPKIVGGATRIASGDYGGIYDVLIGGGALLATLWGGKKIVDKVKAKPPAPAA